MTLRSGLVVDGGRRDCAGDNGVDIALVVSGRPTVSEAAVATEPVIMVSTLVW